MSMTSRYTLVLLAATALCAVPACGNVTSGERADTDAHAHAAPTAFADADRDGRVTRREAGADPALARAFDAYDADGDGELDSAEFARLESGAPLPWWRRMLSPQDPASTRPRDEYARPMQD